MSAQSLNNWFSENFHKAQTDFNRQGIEIEGIKLNIEKMMSNKNKSIQVLTCLLYTSPSPRDRG